MSSRRPTLPRVTALALAAVFAGALHCKSSPPESLTAPEVWLGVADNHTSEAGKQAKVTVSLGARPTGDVTLHFQSSAPTEGKVMNPDVTFTSVNWKAPQTVVVTGVNDDVADGDQKYTVTYTISSQDPAFAQLKPKSVVLVNTDDDTAGFTVSAVSGPTTEAGGQASFTVALRSQPTAEVTLHLDSTNTAEGTVSSKALTFTPVNWKAPQTVLVTGVDDHKVDGAQAYAVTFAATTSTDANYAAIKPADVALSNTDNDSAGITVSAVSGPTTEAGGQATFSVVLNSQPYADVTVHLDSDNTAEGTVSAKSLTFTAQNWNAPQTVTVTGVDDALADGNQPYAVTFGAVTSQDAAYAALALTNVDLTNTDNDSAGITVSAVSGPTTEAGGQATFTVVLTSQPYADVTVNLDSNDTTEGTVSVKSLTFTDQNWNTPQTVTVTGQDDALADGNQPYAVVFSATTSQDATYAAITPANVNLTNTDNDSAGITVSAVSGPTTEAGGQATFTVVLNSQPFFDVTVNFDSNDTTEGTVSAKSLTFTAQNWNTPQTVTVTGQDDALADGNQPYAVVFSATTSQDAAYAAITPGNVNLTNMDDDSVAILVSAASGPTTESGGQATFTVVLHSQPFSDVTVHFDSNDTTEGVVSVTSLTFTAQNWNVPQTVTVTGVDDTVSDGDQAYAVVFSATTSQDSAYAAITPPNVDLVNQDNDPGFAVSAPSGDTTTSGGQATFTVVLRTQPTADVTVNFDSNDTTEGTVSPKSLTFTSTNWNVPQTATVTGVDDGIADEPAAYAIVFSATTSADPGYAAITPASVNLTTRGLAGSYSVENGPDWGNNPPTYTCREACAVVFGGAASDYRCSVNNTSLSLTANMSAWGIGGCSIHPDDFKVNTQYNCGSTGCAYSAYVRDNCSGAVNYCYR